MPLYEYFCEPCDGVFELLRPAREASDAQPCPNCDEDARRVMSHEWSAFIHRDGLPRRLPDDGTFRHLGKKVLKPITGEIDGYRHPELDPADREIPTPTLDAVGAYHELSEEKYKYYAERGGNVMNTDMETVEREARQQLLKGRGTPEIEREKRLVLKADAERRNRYFQQRRERHDAVKETLIKEAKKDVKRSGPRVD